MQYTKPIDLVFKEFGTKETGISTREAEHRIKKYGFNALTEKKRISPWVIFFNQFKSFVVYILLAAVIISIIVGEVVDAIVIGIILIFNGVFGFVQEYKAEKSIEALKRMGALKTKVLRNGEKHEIDAKLLVPGDVILLEEGDKISADVRLFEVTNLETQEAALTGESTPVEKQIYEIKPKTPIAERYNMAFSGTIITKGRGKGVVVKTGMYTEIGKIAKMIQETETPLTPLQKKLEKLGSNLGILTIIICLIVFITGALKTGQYLTMFIAAVALAVAAIPEGLPAIVTISLALGVQRMIKKNALIRKLPSVETLGSTTVICSDKTGTLTHNEMTVKKVYANQQVSDISGAGYQVNGKFSKDPKNFSILLKIGALCNDSNIDEGKVIGDPTEAAFIISAAKAKLDKKKLEKEFPRLQELPFDSDRKLMTTVHKVNNGKLAYTKGGPDIILDRCTKIYINGKVLPLTEKDKKEIMDVNEAFAGDALRVLGFAFKKVTTDKVTEEDLIFVGLQGMIDPPREEVRDSIAKCYSAGIKVAMITGDHKITAMAIAKRLGIKGEAMTGREIDECQDLAKAVKTVNVFARVSPEHKMRIVEAHRKNGEVIAMTGDGVNDAPALKDADIGIAMGISGTDVAKEASSMVLTDDNFTSIVSAVEEGRAIYDNIKKFVNYLLSSNFGEVLVLFVAMLIGFKDNGDVVIPLLAIQILWINLVTDGLPALALGVDPESPNIMKRKPRRPHEGIVSKNMGYNILVTGILICVADLILFNIGLGESAAKGQTMAFTALVVFEIVRVYMIRSQYNIGIFSNIYLLGAISLSFALQAMVVYSPLSVFFKTVPLTLIDLGYIGIAAISLLCLGLIMSRIIAVATKEYD